MDKFVVRLSTGEKKSYSSSDKLLKVGDNVLIDSDLAIELAKIIGILKPSDLKSNESSLNIKKGTGRIIRKLTSNDKEKLFEQKEKIKSYPAKIKKLIVNHGLSMKFIDLELSFDEKKLTVYFSAEGRVDFRGLVSDIIRSFGKQVRLQQIGTRDEAKKFGGIGKCGRLLCCGSFLENIESVTLDMAKDQGLTSNVSKISGLCGKLMCCLSYELEEYRKLSKKMPPIGSDYNFEKIKGKVVTHYTLAQKVLIRTKDGQYVEAKV